MNHVHPMTDLRVNAFLEQLATERFPLVGGGHAMILCSLMAIALTEFDGHRLEDLRKGIMNAWAEHLSEDRRCRRLFGTEGTWSFPDPDLECKELDEALIARLGPMAAMMEYDLELMERCLEAADRHSISGLLASVSFHGCQRMLRRLLDGISDGDIVSYYDEMASGLGLRAAAMGFRDCWRQDSHETTP